MLFPGTSFNESWFIDANLVPLIEKFFPARWSARQRKQGMHIDNARAHNSGIIQNFFGHNPLNRLLHLPYSPYISPHEFYLFGKVESALIGREILDEIDLLDAVTKILNSMSDAELQYVF
jgi:hypothetical protein